MAKRVTKKQQALLNHFRSCCRDNSSEVRLAFAIIERALLDHWLAVAPQPDEVPAWLFLHPDDRGFSFWCEYSGLDPDYVYERIQKAGAPGEGSPK
jgi:hypothetical protein